MKKKEYFIMIGMVVLMIVIVSIIIVISTKKLSDETKRKVEQKVEESIPVKEKESVVSLSQVEQEKLLEAIKVYDSYLISFDGKKEISKLSDKDKITFIAQLPFEKQKEFGLDFESGVSLEKIIEILHHYFGEDISFQPVNYPCFLGDGNYLIYDPDTKFYKSDSITHAHSAYIPHQVFSFYVDGKKYVNEDYITYKISVRKAFSEANSTSFYGNYHDVENKKNKIVDLFTLYGEKAYTSMDDLIRKQYEKQKGLFTEYVYEFQTKTDVDSVYLVELKQ